MNEIKKMLFQKILVGFVLGIFIGSGFMIFFGTFQNDLKKPWDFVRTLFCSGIYGSVGNSARILYKIDQISFLMATAVHYLVVMAGLFILGFSLGWEFEETWVWAIIIGYTIMFVMIWNIMYLTGRRRAKKMNRDLQRWKQAEEKQELRRKKEEEEK